MNEEHEDESKKINDYVFSLYQRNLITTTMYINKLTEIENANGIRLMEKKGIRVTRSDLGIK